MNQTLQNPIDAAALLQATSPLMTALREDLLERAKQPGVEAGLTTSYVKEKDDKRTADPFDVWRRNRVNQVAAAWFLSLVFVRTLEDRGFIERRRIAGPGAEDSEQLFVSIAPFLSPRDYLLTVFRELATLPGAKGIFDAQHNPVWILAPSANGARLLLDFFRETQDDGQLRWTFGGEDTRFLGDLYQDLDEDVRKRFALLQTPDFVESFILDETLTPAIQTFGLDEVKLIDPTCGSGHFLLGAFHRLFEAWQQKATGEADRILALRALKQVHGADLNPYAVAIARFRLTLAFLQVANYAKLSEAPELPLNLCVADSLLHGVTAAQAMTTRGDAGEQMLLSTLLPQEERKAWGDNLFALENEEAAIKLLTQRYHAVVGNPPYITEKDKAKRTQYRTRYKSAHREFALAAPFTERFFQLGVEGGYVGMINANSFMKREFGKKLVEEVLPNLELTKVVDTSGAYIPGHGTPTVIVFGRNRFPGDTQVTTVMGKRGEPSTPEDPSHGFVWSSISDHHSEPGFENDYISVDELERKRFAKHPWSLTGGGASELKISLESKAKNTLGEIAQKIGFICMTRADDVYINPPSTLQRQGFNEENIIVIVAGENVRDWTISFPNEVVFPYNSELRPVNEQNTTPVHRFLWPHRERLWQRREPNGDHREIGLTWYEWSRFQRKRFRTPFSIVYAEIASHNHFVLDRGGKVFNQTAPIIKLPADATEDEHLVLLGYLNSSISLFYLRQVSTQKQMMGGDGVRITEKAKVPHQYNARAVGSLPIPSLNDWQTEKCLHLVKMLEENAQIYMENSASQLLSKYLDQNHDISLQYYLTEGHSRQEQALQKMVILQEELDWLFYHCFGFIEQELLTEEGLPLHVGERPFEVFHAEKTGAFINLDGFDIRYPSLSITDKILYECRLDILRKNHPQLRLLENTQFKRRWIGHQGLFNHKNSSFEEDAQKACHAWLLSRIETYLDDQYVMGSPPITILELVQAFQNDSVVLKVAEFCSNESLPDLEHLFQNLIKTESVPFAAALRYKESGLEKRAAWEHTWELQRREDAGEKVEVPVPPKYSSKDFLKNEYWRLRGKLDVPKERFISYPGAESDEDPSPLVGWAGWDHLQQAQALAALYQRRKDEDGWDREKLTPLLVGIWELVPWIKQWHNEPDDSFGGLRLGDFFDDFLNSELHSHGLTTDDLKAWRPPKKTGRKTKARKK